MKNWMGIAVLLTGFLGACGGDQSKKEEIAPSDASAVMQAVLVKINGSEAELQSGAPPPPSESDEKPLAKIEGGDVSVGAGGVVGFGLTLTPELQAAMCAVFIKVGGADAFVLEELGCTAGKAIQLGTPVRLAVSIELPPNLGDGRFCVEMSGQDNNGLTSNVAEVCVNVSGDAGSGGDTANLPPVAVAGQDRTVAPGQTVTLSAAGSTDTDGSIVAYRWQQVSGTPVVLQNANGPLATFVAPAEASDLVFTLSVTDDDGDQAEDTVNINANGTAGPTVTLSVNPASVVAGASATLQWSSSNAASCTASGAWTGARPTSGTQIVSQAAAGSYVYTLTCSGAAGTTPASDQATLTVTALPQPAVTIGVTPASVGPGESATLQWSSGNASACTASGAWSGTQLTSGSQNVSQSTPGTYAYTLTCSGASGTTPAQATATLTVASSASSDVVHSLADATEGASPYAGLVQAGDGNLYGATCDHGPGGDGTIFRITLAGALTVQHNFVSSTDGNCPTADLVVGSDDNLYGTTSMGGAGGCGGAGCGTVFRQTIAGAYTVLHAFNDTDGNAPTSLIQGSDGNFYGTTKTGGGQGGLGTVFRMTPAGTLTSLHTFTGGANGEEPYGLMEDSTSPGTFYGVTRKGGLSADAGTIFKLASGSVTIQFSFDGTNADSPVGTLAQGPDGKLYGTALHGLSIGGTQDRGALYRIDKAGTNFEILHKFLDDATDGDSPASGMIFADGLLYGTTVFGGLEGKGVVFQMAPDGTGYAVLYSFEGLGQSPSTVVDGENPEAGLVQASDGNLYGTTRQGGVENVGVIYRIAVPGP